MMSVSQRLKTSTKDSDKPEDTFARSRYKIERWIRWSGVDAWRGPLVTHVFHVPIKMSHWTSID